ncbi:cation efflux family protein [Hirsutella rhossiliensis]|uniref:Zinc transporter n=1 Tax=Hirsutella rhossiliensis TaxID=111463 RepID=A0A9P8SKK5_9HYPO|nr:cation efflux family domain-containing protein [Hirsutella rhossiliensis]KAH0964865.1 cation efflux family domain-containing protein [Hirsutella rhossiliensis]
MESINARSIAQPPPPTLIVDDTDAPTLAPTGRLPREQLHLDSPASSMLSPSSAMSSDGDAGEAASAPEPTNPFNFTTQAISSSPVKSNIGQRRGHRYKHSSISAQHQIFQEPPQRPPPVLPASLPIPTVAEAWKSMHRDQRTRLYWSLCHLAVAVFIFFRSHASLAAMALSHLVFFDAGSAAVCAAVDVLGNFEVWRRSSIRHPFGLERAEVLVGFALSIFLLFGGFDLVSHNLKHFLETLGNHEAHHHHAHAHATPGSVGLVAAIAIASTLVSAYGLKNHARIAKVMRVSYLAALPSVLSNPFHFLTLFFSALVAVLPLLSISLYAWLDRLICAIIALAMFGLGIRVAVAQGLMLLMSYGGSSGNSGVTSVLREIESESAISRVQEAQFWQVNYGLCMANVTVSVAKGYDETALCKLRNRISSLIQNRLGEGYGTGGNIRWEVTLQMNSEGGA